MGAVIDNVEPYSRCSPNVVDNFATACNKCNASRGNTLQSEFKKRSPLRQVKGKYGEPEN